MCTEERYADYEKKQFYVLYVSTSEKNTRLKSSWWNVAIDYAINTNTGNNMDVCVCICECAFFRLETKVIHTHKM